MEYERHSRASLNISKTKILSLNPQNKSAYSHYFDSVDRIKILGLFWSRTIQESSQYTHNQVLQGVRHFMLSHKSRPFDLHTRVLFLKQFAFSILWYVAQVFYPSVNILRQVQIAAMFSLWFSWPEP